MATEDYQKRHEEMRNLIASEIDADRIKIETDELLDLEEETENELALTITSTEPIKGSGIKLPTDDTVVTWNRDGSPRSFFRDPYWTFCVGSNEETIRFGHIHEELQLNLSSKLCIPLVYFHRLITFFDLPGNDPLKNISSYNTGRGTFYESLHLCSLLKKMGYLYGERDNFMGLSTLSADTLRTELIEAMERDDHTRVARLASTITSWINISRLAPFPPEYAAPFTTKEMWADGLNKKVVKYLASKKKPYDVIDFKDLVQMFKTAKKYLDHYVDDALFIGSVFDQLLSADAPLNPQGEMLTLVSSGYTEDLVKATLKRKFAIDPDTGDKWFRPVLDKKSIMIRKVPLKNAIYDIESVCIFLLLIWSGMRAGELAELKVSYLSVDGNPLDQNRSALEQVRQGNNFTLTRVVTKTTKNHSGKKKDVPIPRSGAEAFAVLVDLSRKGRLETGNPYLLPHGELGFAAGHGFIERKVTDPVHRYTVYQRFQEFCVIAGVKPYHPHRCRKTIATILINHDPKCIELIKDLLCHEDIQMTRKYLMSLPGVAEEARKIYVKSQSEALTEILTYAAEGKLAGPAGDRANTAILDNIEAFKGKRLANTIASLEQTLIASNFLVVRTPASWCLRFDVRIPWDAPCLPPPEKRRTGEIATPNFDKCQDWLCKHSGYTPTDLPKARQRRAWADNVRAGAVSPASRAYYDKMVAFWDGVIDQLENGRPEVVSLHLLERFRAEVGAHA